MVKVESGKWIVEKRFSEFVGEGHILLKTED